MTFEEWFDIKKIEMIRNGLGLIAINRRRDIYLEAWKASRKELVIELPNDEKVRAYDYYHDGYNSGISACEMELENKGLNVIRK